MANGAIRTSLKKHFNFESNWIVALAAFWVNFCLLGVHRSNGVIYSALVDIFGVSREAAAWPSGILGFSMCITGALSGILVHYVSIRKLAFLGSALASASVSLCSCATRMWHIEWLYGALQGIGIGMIVPITHVVLNQNFTKYRALALGIAYAGSSAGSFVFPPLAHRLYTVYGLEGTFLLLGGIMLNSLLGALWFRTREPRKNGDSAASVQLESQQKSGNEDNVLQLMSSGTNKEKNGVNRENRGVDTETAKKAVEVPQSGIAKFSEKLNCPPFEKQKLATSLLLAANVLTSPAFYVISAAYACYFSSSAIFLMVVIDFAKDRGVPAELGVYLISAYSTGDLIGRLAGGWLADQQLLARPNLVKSQMLAMGALTVSLGAWWSPGALGVPAVALGVLGGGVMVNHSVLLTEYLGLERLPLAMGFSSCLVGLSGFLRPMVIGCFRDRSQRYDQLFVFLGSLQVAVTAMWYLEVVVKRFLLRRSVL